MNSKALTVVAVVQAVQADAVSLVFAVEWRVGGGVGAVVDRGDVLTQSLCAHEEVIEIGAMIVHLAVAVLPHRHTNASFGVTLKGLGTGATIVVALALVKELGIQWSTVIVFGTGRLFDKVVVQNLQREMIYGKFGSGSEDTVAASKHSYQASDVLND